MYTTIARVRTLSGFDDTSNITDENIKSKIIIATGMVDSSIGDIYSLPIAYRYQNTLDFSGTATTGSMDITINGVAYSLSVTSGQTASQIADTFRMACANSTDFVTDALGFWASVMIISQSTWSDGYAEVNITNAPDTYITTTIGSRVKRYTPILEQITAEIATALLFIDVYGVEGQDTGKDGPSRMDRINEYLQKLQGVHESGQQIRLFDDITNVELSLSTTTLMDSYPNDTSEVSTTDSTSPKVWMNKTF